MVDATGDVLKKRGRMQRGKRLGIGVGDVEREGGVYRIQRWHWTLKRRSIADTTSWGMLFQSATVYVWEQRRLPVGEL